MGCGASLPPDARTIQYGELLANVNTGDILLYSGKGISSAIIRCGSLGLNWSHTGIIIVQMDKYGQRVPYVIESNPPTGLRDVVTGRIDKSGPQMVNLADRLRSYNGFFIAWRPLVNNHNADPGRTFYTKRLLEFVRKQQPHTKYDYNPIDFWGVISRSNTDSSRDYFCTEFAAAALVYAQILQLSQPCENYSLDDFSSIGYLPTFPTVSYDREMYLQLPIKTY